MPAQISLAPCSGVLHRRLSYRLFIWLEQRIYTRKDLPVIAVSRKVENDLERFYGRRNYSFVVYNGVESTNFNPQVRECLRGRARGEFGYSASDFVLLLVGNDWRTKGLPCLLEAAALLRERQVKIAVVGRDDISSFRAMLESKDLNSSVQFLPLRPDPEFYYAAADAYAGPSLEDAFGIPPLEAMSCALPVIVSRHSGVSELITHGEDGYILEDPEQPEELAALVARLHEDQELRQRMGRRAAETARQYTWEHNAAQLKVSFSNSWTGNEVNLFLSPFPYDLLCTPKILEQLSAELRPGRSKRLCTDTPSWYSSSGLIGKSTIFRSALGYVRCRSAVCARELRYWT